ncbi:hypothetical protein N9Q91_00070 [Gammaproteobacteria bacterium]|jgi:hypothetical protein|nr:hypothetical protein [Gammaproteobacteria bacterium]MDB9908299.1 hypothetical protein [Gammaproteobacteria bacterium]|tara:strand:+ start:171 stop:974 length:804 start_codon:yes stop_codon:yes gene_type:complete
MKILKDSGWEIISYAGADKIIQNDFKEKFSEIENILLSFKISQMEIMCEGGGKHPIVKRLSQLLNSILEQEVSFKSTIVTTIRDERVVGTVDEAVSHKVDFFHQGEKKNLGLELEWNSKVLAYERDIMNFRRLFFNSAISVGIVITRGESLDSNLLSLCENFFKTRINANDWPSSIKSIQTELSSYKDSNNNHLKFKTFTPTQIKQINVSIDSGLEPYKAIARNYFQQKWRGQTSHIDSLVERIERGGFQGIPFLLIGIPDKAVDLN